MTCQICKQHYGVLEDTGSICIASVKTGIIELTGCEKCCGKIRDLVFTLGWMPHVGPKEKE